MVESLPHALAFFATQDPLGFIQGLCVVSLGPVCLAGAIWVKWVERKGHSGA